MHRLFTISFILVAGIVLCSCASSVKQKELQAIEIPENWQWQSESSSEYADKNRPDSLDFTDSTWFDYFENNTQLQALIELGILSNKDLVIASSRVERALAELRVIQPNRLPTVDINAQGKRQKINEASQNILSGEGLSNDYTASLGLRGRSTFGEACEKSGTIQPSTIRVEPS